jgi:dTMP kinase
MAYRQGRLIVLEGGEGCGKTTQLKRLESWLMPQMETYGFRKLQSTREPGGSSLCQKIRQVLLMPDREEAMQDRAELLLYAADRAQHVAAWLRPWLTEGDLVLCDRYTASTVAYQGYGRGLDLSLIHQLNAVATQGLEPDLTLWLDLDPEIGMARAMARGTRDRMEQADLQFHTNVRSGFAALYRDSQNKSQKNREATNPETFIQIQADQSVEAIEQEIRQALEAALKRWA